MEADNITKEMKTTRRHLKLPDVLNKAYIKSTIENSEEASKSSKASTSLKKQLQWVLKPCDTPSFNWYICEKSIDDYDTTLKSTSKSLKDYPTEQNKRENRIKSSYDKGIQVVRLE